MIVNQKKNLSFRSTLEYVLGKEKSTLIDTNMGGETPRQLAAEFAAARRHRPNLKRACGHIIISIPHRNANHSRGEYHEHLDDEQYAALAHRWLLGMEFLGEGLSCSQYLIARHHDTRHEHIHIIASRIRMDGSVVSDSWDYRRSEVIVRQLEKEFNLEPTPCSNERIAQKVEEKGISTTVADRRAPTQKQKHHDSGFPTVKQRLASLIDEACSDSPTVTQLIGRLQHQGVIVHPQFSTKGLFKEALAFELDGVKVAGNKIGSAYSFPGLLRKRGVQYEPQRDMRALVAASLGEVVPLAFCELLPASSMPPLQEKESPPIDEAAYRDTLAADTFVSPLPSQVEAPITKKPQKLSFQERKQAALDNYLSLWMVLQKAKGRIEVREVSPGSWTFVDGDYAFAYNQDEELFTVGHVQRGLLVRYKERKPLLIGEISPMDITAFERYDMSRPQPTSSKPQRKSQRSLE